MIRQMEEETKRATLQSFPFMVAALFLAVTTHYLLSLYGTVHWRVAGPSAHLSGMVLELQMKAEDQQTSDGAELIDKMKKETNPRSRLAKARSTRAPFGEANDDEILGHCTGDARNGGMPEGKRYR
jgi:hypothetical protein